MKYAVSQSVGLFIADRGKPAQKRKLRRRRAQFCGKLVCSLLRVIDVLFYPVGFFLYEAVYPLIGKSAGCFYNKRAVLVNTDGKGFPLASDKLVIRRKIISLYSFV